MAVYLDLVMLLNFLVDLLLLLGTNRLAGHPPGGKRAAFAAVLGGVYAGACMLPGFSFLAGTLWRIVSLALMAVLAFGWDQSALRRGVLFVFLSMALGGVAVVLGSGGFWSLVLAAGLVCLLCLLGFRGRAGGHEYVPISITQGEKTVNLTALVDTGNTLRDPVSGRPVLVVDARVASKLVDLSDEQLSHPIETLAQGLFPGLRLIPYCAVGKPAGMLLGLSVDELKIDGKVSDSLVAFAPQRIGNGYQALAGGVL